MPYTPSDNELVFTTNPDAPNDPPVVTFIAHRATKKEKEDFLGRMQARLSPGEEVEGIQEWMENPNVYLGIDDGDKITMISEEYIVGPCKDDDESTSSDQE
jgi:hypothetical protein